MVANDDQGQQSHDEVTNDDDGPWLEEAETLAEGKAEADADDDYAGDTIMLPLIFWHD